MRRPDPALCATLTIVALVFARALAGDFVYDDLVLVERNPALHEPWRIGALVTTPLFGAEQGFWRPLTLVLLAWGKWLGGGGPVVLHAIALGLHLWAVAQAAWLGGQLGLSRRAALGGALLFGLCPVVVEPVSWVADVNDPLWAALALAALRAHLRWRERGAHGFPGVAAVWLALALFSKENALSIGLLFVALDLAFAEPPRPQGRALLRSYGIYAAVAAQWLALRAIVLDSAGVAIAGAAPGEWLAQPLLRGVEIVGRMLLALCWPADPTPFRAPAAVLEPGSAEFVAPAMACAGLAVLLAVAAVKRWRPVTFAVLTFLALVLPVAVRPQALGAHPLVDRYLYLAACTSALALAWAVARVTHHAPVILVVLALGCGVASFVQIGTWRNQVTLVETGLAHHPDDPWLSYMRGRIHHERFLAGGEPAQLAAARARFERAATLLARPQWGGPALTEPLRADVAVGLAFCALADEGRSPAPRWDRAVDAFEKITAEHPQNALAFLGLGVAQASAGRLPDARRAFERAVELDPRLPEARVNLARVLAMQGDRAAARDQLDRALELRPDDAQARAMRNALGR